MNYTVTPTKNPVGFEIRDANGNLIAFCIDESTAQVFAHVPELLEMLDACTDMSKMYSLGAAVELQEKLKQYRP